MSAIDERIVAMRFDNAQFEKGVRTSMRTLEDLKAASNLDDVAGNLSDFSKNFNKTLNFDGTTKDAGIFSKALTGLGKVAKKTFNASTFPLQALGRSLKSLGSYTRVMLGIDLASSLVNTGKTVLRAFTIDPLRSGWSEYELKMDSIKTIMTGTVDTYKKMMEKKNPGFLYDEEKHLDYVKQGLEELNTYADKTIYSFQDMTTSVGKFTNAGIEFDTSISAVKGISNLAAFSGQGAAQASSAMYNIAQSLGVGHLERIDWKSIELANMGTPQFRQTMIELGLALGTLKKEGEEVYALTEEGLIDKNTIVTVENFRETLTKSKWATNDVLLGALSVFAGELSKDELKDMFHLTDEIAEKFYDLGQRASESATQVRTFTKMWDALKEAAQSGWAQTWELIFGDMKEATDFWTGLNNRFSEILNSMANGRNDLLKRWRGQGRYWNYSTGEWYWKQIPDAKDGRKILIDGLNDLLDVFQRLGGAIGTAWEKVFGVLTADKLVAMTEKFSGFTSKLKTWLGDANKDGTRLNKITKGFQGLFGMLKGGGTFIKGAITTVANTLRLDKLIDLGINAFSGIGEWLTGVAGSIESVWNKIGQTEIAKKLSGFFSELWDSVSKFFGEVNPDTGKTGFAEWLESTTTKITDTWDGFTKSDFYQNVSGFFGDLFDSMIDFFTPRTIQGKMGNTWTTSPFQTMLDNVSGWFDGAWKTIENKWTEFTNSDFYKNASGLFENLWTSVIGFFQPRTIQGKMGNSWTTSDFQMTIESIIGWFDGAWKTIENKWTEFTNSDFYKNASGLFGDLWRSVTGFFTPKTIPGKMGNSWTEKSDFQVMIDNILGFFDGGWTTISGIWDTFKGTDFYKNASGFFTGLWDSVSGFLSSSFTVPEGGSWDDSPIGKAVHTVFGWIESAGAWLDENFGPIAEGVGKFLTDTWGWIMDKTGWSEQSTKAIQLPKNTKMVAFASASDVNYDMINEVPSEERQNAFLSFFTKITDAISTVATKVGSWSGWDAIGKFIGDVFSAIGSAVQTIKDITGLSILDSVSRFVTTVFDTIARIAGTMLDLVGRMGAGGWEAIGAWAQVFLYIFGAEGVIGLIGQFGKFAGLSTFADIGTGIRDFSIGMLALAAGVAILSSLSIDKLAIGAAAITILGSIIAGITALVNKNSAIKAASEPLTGWPKVVDNLVSGIVKWGSLAVVFGQLPEIIKAFKGTEGSMDGFFGFAAGISTLMLAVAASLRLMPNGLGAMGIAGEVLAFGASITLILAMFRNVAEDIGTWYGSNDNGFADHFEAFGDFLGTIGEGIGKLIGGLKAGNLIKTVEGEGKAAEAAAEINTDDLEHLINVMEAFKIIGNNLPPDPGVFARWFGKEQSMSMFGENIKNLGGGFASFANEIKTISNWDQVTQGISAISNLLDAAWMIAAINNIISQSNGSPALSLQLIDVLTGMAGALHDLKYDDKQNLLGFSEFAESLNSGIELAAMKITVEPILTAIKTQLLAGRSEIQSVLSSLLSVGEFNGANNAYSIPELDTESYNLLVRLFSGSGTSNLFGDGDFTIDLSGLNVSTEEFEKNLSGFQGMFEQMLTRFSGSTNLEINGDTVFDASNLDDMPMLSLQNGTLVLSGTVSLDDSSVASITSAIHSEGSGIRSAINALGGRMDNVAAAIRAIKIVLNTGVIAGAVDDAMGKSTVMRSRTGTSSGNTRNNLPQHATAITLT